MARRLIEIVVMLAAVMIILPPAELHAQMAIKYSVIAPVAPDSADVARGEKRHFWRAAATVGGLNIGLWAFDRFVQHGDYSYISLHTIRNNFRKGFIWDNDRLGTNMFLHPYNGNLFYNAGRANGFNYWQSGLFALGGSWMWEMFMEREYPSTNDVIATPIGGMAIGEVLFRISDTMIDDRTAGWERFEREAGAFILSPVRGFTRIITGDAWRRRPTSGQLFGTPDVGIEFSGGARVLSFTHRKVSDTRLGGAVEFNMEYGDRYEGKSKKPYNYFTLRAGLNLINRQPFLSRLNIMGRLMAEELVDNNVDHLSLGLYQYFDYYDSDTISSLAAKCPYKLGVPASVGGGLLYRRFLPGKVAFDAFGHVNAVVLGAILSDHYMVDERNYNLAMGYSVKGGFNLVFGRNKFSIRASQDFYRLFTFKGYARGIDLTKVDYRTLNAQGDKSTASFGVTEFSVNLRVWKRLFLSMGMEYYFRTTHYRDYNNVRSLSLVERMMVTWKL